MPWSMYVQGNRVEVGLLDPGMTVPVTTRKLTAREAVRMAQHLLACASTIFAEEDANAPVAAPPEVPVGETMSPIAQGQADQLAARGLRPRRRRTPTE